jgi:hypothetical protein
MKFVQHTRAHMHAHTHTHMHVHKTGAQTKMDAHTHNATGAYEMLKIFQSAV